MNALFYISTHVTMWISVIPCQHLCLKPLPNGSIFGLTAFAYNKFNSSYHYDLLVILCKGDAFSPFCRSMALLLQWASSVSQCKPKVLKILFCFCKHVKTEVQEMRTEGCWFDPRAQPIVLPRIDDSYSIRIHSALPVVHCFDSGYMGKQLVAWREYCGE